MKNKLIITLIVITALAVGAAVVFLGGKDKNPTIFKGHGGVTDAQGYVNNGNPGE